MALSHSNDKMEDYSKCHLTSISTKRRRVCKGKSSLKKPLIRVRRNISMDAANSLFNLSVNCDTPIKDSSNSLHEKKKVTFAPMATVVTMPKPTKEDAQQSWYGADEYRMFELDRRESIAAIRWVLENEIYLDPEQYITVGLENQLSRDQLYARKYKLMRHTFCVLEQQYCQRYREIYGTQTWKDVNEISCTPPVLTPPMIHEDGQQRRFYYSDKLSSF
jgi:hypothetical protein